MKGITLHTRAYANARITIPRMVNARIDWGDVGPRREYRTALNTITTEKMAKHGGLERIVLLLRIAHLSQLTY
jgi:hypothetical protein